MGQQHRAQRSRPARARGKERSCTAAGSHSRTQDRSSHRNQERRARQLWCPVVECIRIARVAESLHGETDNLKARIVHVGAYLDDFSASFMTLRQSLWFTTPGTYKSTHQCELFLEIRWGFLHLHYRVVAVTYCSGQVNALLSDLWNLPPAARTLTRNPLGGT
jgi:hypothetical protein